MKIKYIYILGISSFLCLLPTTAWSQTDKQEQPSQEELKAKATKDSIKITNRYGIRLGTDISKLVRTALDDNYSGFEINADFRLSRRIYVAGELGTEERNTVTQFLNITTSGSYFKGGIDYNAYDNWYGMENMIYGGLRVGASTFKQTLNSFTVYTTDQYWEHQFTVETPEETSGLTALWTELIVGLKAEVLPNLYIGLNAQLKMLISNEAPEKYENVYIPGYNKTYDSGRFGVGYGYSISYLIPLYKKEK